ncbi:hypothetical protein PGTUg99_031188 [Puccinia graminis f. sp. tritici]|uniref:Uncharacterized protein n=1 Tax=Puccinia graminis f. sp. tritici TaxID=56615 RepID=A0A5B0Q8A0_PUCGR|nr:hypothetical protein PGTUg99_031188 [Puccinia graminis f. sp. tritici]
MPQSKEQADKVEGDGFIFIKHISPFSLCQFKLERNTRVCHGSTRMMISQFSSYSMSRMKTSECVQEEKEKTIFLHSLWVQASPHRDALLRCFDKLCGMPLHTAFRKR